MLGILSKEIVFGTPLYTTCKSEHSEVIRTQLGKEEAELVRGGGEGAGTYTRHKGLKQSFM